METSDALLLWMTTTRDRRFLVQQSHSNDPPALDLQEQIHSCQFCQIQEIDPTLQKLYSVDSPEPVTTVRYRGATVLAGALNGCAFFSDALKELDKVFVAQGVLEGCTSANFRANNWIYELTFGHGTGGLDDHLQTAEGVWTCAVAELSVATRYPHQERSKYLLISSQGTDFCIRLKEVTQLNHSMAL
jgi:hypothetical protein